MSCKLSPRCTDARRQAGRSGKRFLIGRELRRHEDHHANAAASADHRDVFTFLQSRFCALATYELVAQVCFGMPRAEARCISGQQLRARSTSNQSS